MSTTSKRVKIPLFQPPDRADESFRFLEINGDYRGCSWHFHPELQISYVMQGSGKRVVGDCLHSIEPGEITLLGSNLPHVWRYDSPAASSDVQALVVHFRPDFLGGDFFRKPEMRDVRLLLARADQGLQFVGATREFAARSESLKSKSGMERLLLLLEILNCFAQTREVMTLSSSQFQPAAAELDSERMRRVCDFIAANFRDPIDRDLVADIAHMSPRLAFSRFFKLNTGMSFRHFLADVRVGQACQQLADPEQSISDVALSCGFNDLSTFHRVFRKLRGVTPSEYRRQIVELVSPP